MIAFVLSGGGNRGALQVGALRGLREAGIAPDFFVGSSVGALNALYLASRQFNEESVQGLQRSWMGARKRDIFPGSPLVSAYRFLTGRDSLHNGDAMRAFIARQMPESVTRFGELAIPVYLTAADLRTKRLYLFGEDADTPFLDAVVASCSIPVLHPPVDYASLQLVDGGVLENVPADIAMDKGASVIYVLNVGYGGQRLSPVSGVTGIFGRVVGMMLAQSLFMDLERAQDSAEIDLHHVHLGAFDDVAFTDFSRTAHMIEAGLQAVRSYLRSPSPLRYARRSLPEYAAAGRVPGAREWPLARDGNTDS